MRPSRPRQCLTISVRLKPSARDPGIEFAGTNAVVKVRAQPIEGRANAEALAVIADAFGVPKSRVELVRGTRSRVKRVRITEPARLPPGFQT